MGFWLEFFTDKRFGWRFKLANFIMGDYLRNYLAAGCLLRLSHIIELCSDSSEPLMKHVKGDAEKASKSVVDVMEM